MRVALKTAKLPSYSSSGSSLNIRIYVIYYRTYNKLYSHLNYIRRWASVLHLSLHNDKNRVFCNISIAKPRFLLPYCVVAELRNPDRDVLEHVWSGLESLSLTHKTPTADTPHLFSMAWSAKSNLATSQPPTEGTREPTQTKAPLISFMTVLRGSRWMILQPEPVMCSASRRVEANGKNSSRVIVLLLASDN